MSRPAIPLQWMPSVDGHLTVYRDELLACVDAAECSLVEHRWAGGGEVDACHYLGLALDMATAMRQRRCIDLLSALIDVVGDPMRFDAERDELVSASLGAVRRTVGGGRPDPDLFERLRTIATS